MKNKIQTYNSTSNPPPLVGAGNVYLAEDKRNIAEKEGGVTGRHRSLVTITPMGTPVKAVT